MGDRQVELQDTLRDNPTDEATWGVLQDWLLEAGDPRGAMMAASGAELSKLLTEHAPGWFGREVKVAGNEVSTRHEANDDYSPGVTATFERGHIRRLKTETLWNGTRAGWGQEWMHPLITRLLEHPVGRLVQEIEVRVSPWSEFYYEGLIESFAAAGPIAVRTMYVGDDDQHSWTNVPDVSTLWAAAPWLEQLTLEGANIELGQPDHARLRSLTLRTGGLPQEPVRALLTAELPALQDLQLWFGDEEYGAENSVEDIVPLLQRKLPALRNLGLVNCMFSDALVPHVLASPLLPQLQALRLGHGVLTNEGAQLLLDHANALRHLQTLDLDEAYLSEEMIERLSETFGEALTAEDQLEDDVDGDEVYRYVSLGE